jgi:hypothetical protein
MERDSMNALARLRQLVTSETSREGQPEQSTQPDESDGELDKIVNVTLMCGPEYARDLGVPDEGDMFVTENTVYRYQDGQWQDLDVDTSWLIDHIKAYALSQELQEAQRRWDG